MVRLTTSKRLELQKKFAAFDKSGDKKLDFDEMKKLLLQGNPNLPEKQLRTLYDKVDKNRDGAVDFDEFIDYLYGAKPAYEKAPDACNDKFTLFCGEEMDGKEFCKFCQDCGLIDKGFRKEDIDVTFAKVLPRGKRKISLEVSADGFSQYDKLLSLLAEKKKRTPAEIFDMVAGGEVTSSGTKADNVRFHDDKTLYTGAHGHNEKHGREDAEAAAPRIAKEKFDIGIEGDWTACAEKFKLFDQTGDGLTNREFVKLCEDAHVIDRGLTKGEVDIVFTQIGKQKFAFEDFQQAMRLVAERKKAQIADIQAVIAACSGPNRNATVADAVKFHDDPDMYTGMHAGEGLKGR